MLADVGKIIRDTSSTVDFKMLNKEDIANAVITSLSTPPNVLVRKNTYTVIPILICIIDLSDMWHR